MQPTIGRIVYYKSRGSMDGVYPSVDRAAIITDVMIDDISVDKPFQIKCTVFNPEGMYFTDWLEQGDKPGQWDWMPYQKEQKYATGTLSGPNGIPTHANPEVLGTQSNQNTQSN